MVNVQLIGEFEFSKEELLSKNYAKALMTDCLMEFKLNDESLYDDWVCPLELYFQYLHWKSDLIDNKIFDFNYNSDDNGVNPIFSFKLKEKKWIFVSGLTTPKLYYEISFIEILEFFDLFEKELLKHQK